MAAPTPITATDVPTSITAPLNLNNRTGIAYAYNVFVAQDYSGLSAAAQATYVPPTVTSFILGRLGALCANYLKQAYEADLAPTNFATKWPLLSQAQRDAIKTTLASV